VAQALQESGLEPGNLVIELTESTTMYNTDANLERFQRLKALGVRLAIDDFGTGLLVVVLPSPLPDRHSEDRPLFVSRLTNSTTGPSLHAPSSRWARRSDSIRGRRNRARTARSPPVCAGFVAGKVPVRKGRLPRAAFDEFIRRPSQALWTAQAAA